MKCTVVGVSDPFPWKNKKTGEQSTAVVLHVAHAFFGRPGIGQAVESVFMDARSSEYSVAQSLKPGMYISVSRNGSGFVDEINVLADHAPNSTQPAGK